MSNYINDSLSFDAFARQFFAVSPHIPEQLYLYLDPTDGPFSHYTSARFQLIHLGNGIFEGIFKYDEELSSSFKANFHEKGCFYISKLHLNDSGDSTSLEPLISQAFIISYVFQKFFKGPKDLQIRAVGEQIPRLKTFDFEPLQEKTDLVSTKTISPTKSIIMHLSEENYVLYTQKKEELLNRILEHMQAEELSSSSDEEDNIL